MGSPLSPRAETLERFVTFVEKTPPANQNPHRAQKLYEEEVAALLSLEPRDAQDPRADVFGEVSAAPRSSDDENVWESLLLDPGTIQECQVCFEPKHSDLFPPRLAPPGASSDDSTAQARCACLPDACLACLQEHLRHQIKSKEWRREGSLTCPMCNRGLRYEEIEEYADGETLAM